MGVFDIFKRLGKSKKLDTSLQLHRGSDAFQSGYGFGHYSGYEIELEGLYNYLKSCNIDYEKSSPYLQVKISKLAFEVFPFAKRAIQDMASMVGNIEIKINNGGEEIIDQINSELKELPIVSELDWKTPHDKGINNFVERFSKTLLLNGMAFTEERLSDSLEYEGALLFEPTNFDYVREDLGPVKLRYLDDQYPDINDPFFHYVGYDYKNNHPWAQPLISGGKFFTELLISIFVAIRNINKRKGSPAELTAIGIEDNDLLRDPNLKNAYVSAMDTLEKLIKKAIQMQSGGKPSNVVARFPAKLEIKSQAFGVEGLNEINPEILNICIAMFANVLEIPVEFIGIVLGTSGFSPERFKKLYEIWGTKIDNLRERIKPTITTIIKNYLRTKGYSPILIENLNFEYLNIEVPNKREEQENRSKQAEADFKTVQTANTLAQYDLEAARLYMIDRGLIDEEWITNFDDNGPEQEPEEERNNE